MEQHIVIYFQSSSNAAQACAAQIFHARTGGLLHRLGTPAQSSDQDCDAEQHAGFPLDEMYCEMMTSRRGGIFDVPHEHCAAITTFIRSRIGVLKELKAAIVCVSADTDSQTQARSAIETLLSAGLAAKQLHLMFTAPADDQAFEEAYAAILQFADQAQIVVPRNAVLPAPAVFEKAHQLQLPIAAVLNGARDFDAELVAGRFNDAPKTALLALAHRAIAQRELLSLGEALERVGAALALTRITAEEWKAENPALGSRKRMRQVAH
ncbi:MULTISPECIES: hypothetical protein [unclassified Paraburkholderia]|uniref:hypothetical protein n=1 Tax=unclassified Paraburkholderia TaxID=2615204 RepID=UPI002AAFB291|nr:MULTISPECIES: hypothetical protein [unclassified Paraburkholderia]